MSAISVVDGTHSFGGQVLRGRRGIDFLKPAAAAPPPAAAAAASLAPASFFPLLLLVPFAPSAGLSIVVSSHSLNVRPATPRFAQSQALFTDTSSSIQQHLVAPKS